jgi:hypothetical protein
VGEPKIELSDTHWSGIPAKIYAEPKWSDNLAKESQQLIAYKDIIGSEGELSTNSDIDDGKQEIENIAKASDNSESSIDSEDSTDSGNSVTTGSSINSRSNAKSQNSVDSGDSGSTDISDNGGSPNDSGNSGSFKYSDSSEKTRTYSENSVDFDNQDSVNGGSDGSVSEESVPTGDNSKKKKRSGRKTSVPSKVKVQSRSNKKVVKKVNQQIPENQNFIINQNVIPTDFEIPKGYKAVDSESGKVFKKISNNNNIEEKIIIPEGNYEIPEGFHAVGPKEIITDIGSEIVVTETLAPIISPEEIINLPDVQINRA